MPLKSVSTELITNKIYMIRGHKVMLDRDLSRLYGVTTGNLNKAVKRNINRFPDDFMFRLSKDEAESLRFQFGSLKRGTHFKYLPSAFTEQGIAMLSSVLKSERAIEINIIIMRTFVRIREILINHKELALKLNDMERKLARHDKEIMAILRAIRLLMKEETNPKGKMGFHP